MRIWPATALFTGCFFDEARPRAREPRNEAAETQAETQVGSSADAGGATIRAEPLPVEDAGAIGTPSAGLPCAVEQLLVTHCRACHGTMPAPSVPMSLVTYADLTAKGAGGAPMLERVKARMHDPVRPMPPVSAMKPLTAEALETLDGWLEAGAPASTDTCVQTDPPSSTEADTSECEYLPTLLAHDGQDANDEQGYEVPLVDDHYECFNFAIPWNKPTQAIAFFPAIGDRRVLHHMILYALKSGAAPGTHGRCDEGPDRTLVGGWSPGQDRQEWPSDYGMLMPVDASGVFQLEIHYNNLGKHRTRVRSGLKVCATSKFRPKTLAMHMLGTFDISLQPGRQQVVNSCVVASDKGPATVVAASPHMHLLGVHLRTVVKHTDGTQETITDQPYAFADQGIQFLQRPIVVRKGDVLTTTCTYDNSTNRVIHYSKGSDGEMCGNALVAHPPGSITGGLVGGLVATLGVPNICMGAGAEPVLGL